MYIEKPFPRLWNQNWKQCADEGLAVGVGHTLQGELEAVSFGFGIQKEPQRQSTRIILHSTSTIWILHIAEEVMKRCWLIYILIKLVQNEDADNKYKANLSEEDSAQQRNSKESHWPSHDIPARGISTRATIATHLPVRLITFRYFWLVLEVDSSTFPRSHDFQVEKCWISESPNLLLLKSFQTFQTQRWLPRLGSARATSPTGCGAWRRTLSQVWVWKMRIYISNQIISIYIKWSIQFILKLMEVIEIMLFDFFEREVTSSSTWRGHEACHFCSIWKLSYHIIIYHMSSS